jgi:hypothetical protein
MAFKRIVSAFLLMAASSSLADAQGISNRRDGSGNLVRDSGIAVQNAPRPMTNNSVRPAQAQSYVAIRAPHRFIVMRR